MQSVTEVATICMYVCVCCVHGYICMCVLQMCKYGMNSCVDVCIFCMYVSMWFVHVCHVWCECMARLCVCICVIVFACV